MVDGQYAAALEAYEKASAVEGDPALLYNRARALTALQRHAEALRHYLAFGERAPPELLEKVPQLAELTEAAREQVCFLHLFILQPEARIFMDGKEVPREGIEDLWWNAGQVRLRVESPGYFPYEKLVRLPGGSKFSFTPVLVAMSRVGLLEVTASVPGAAVFLDAKRVGNAPVQLQLDPGTHRIEVQHADYEPYSTQVVATQGVARNLKVELERKTLLVQRWWFWTGLGALAAGGAALAIAYSTERAPDVGTIPPGTITVPTN